MTDDDPGAHAKDRELEIRVRSALRYNADRVVGLETDLRGSRRSRLVPALAGAAATLAVVGGVVGLTEVHSGGRSANGPASISSFAGHRWLLTSVRHGGRTMDVPAGAHGEIAFTTAPKCTGTYQPLNACSGELTYYDTVRNGSANFSLTSRGFSAQNDIDPGFDGKSAPLITRSITFTGQGEVVTAMDAVTKGVVVAAIDHGALTLSRAGYEVQFAPNGSGSANTSASPATNTAQTARFTGSSWRLDVVVHNARKTAVPAKLAVDISFGPPLPSCRGPQSCPGDLSFSDGVNSSSGTYRLTGDGFHVADDLATSAVGYVGKDPVQLETIAAMGSLTGDVEAAVDDQGHLDISTAGYVLTFSRLGTVTEAPSVESSTDSESGQESGSESNSPAGTSSTGSATLGTSYTPAPEQGSTSAGLDRSTSQIPPTPPTAAASAGLVGRPWLLRTITSGGATADVTIVQATATFEPDGTLHLNNTAGDDDGKFTERPGGFTTEALRHFEVSWASDADHIALREQVVNAFNAIGDASSTSPPDLVTAQVTKSGLVMSAGNYRMTFVRT